MQRLLEQFKNLIPTRHYSYRTEQTYIHWIKQYIFFHGKRHPAEMVAAEVSEFLIHLIELFVLVPADDVPGPEGLDPVDRVSPRLQASDDDAFPEVHVSAVV